MFARRLMNYMQERVRRFEQREALNRIVARFQPAPLGMTAEAATLLSELNEAGNVMLPPLAPTDQLQALREDLRRLPCFDPWHPELGDFDFADTPPDTNNARIRGVAQLPAARRIANHPLVLSIASNYLRCLPTIDDVIAWWSLPGRPAPKEEQFFHRDNDAVRFVKLFVYLGRVGEEDGPHVFVRGSQRDNRLIEKRRRYQDAEVLTVFGDASRAMTGEFGSAFLEDTFGLHKGAVPTKEPRLLFQVRYTSFPSVFARGDAVRCMENEVDPYINRYIA